MDSGPLPGPYPGPRHLPDTCPQVPALSLRGGFFPAALQASGPSSVLGDRLGAVASLGGGASQTAFLVLRQLLGTSRAGEGSVPVGRSVSARQDRDEVGRGEAG